MSSPVESIDELVGVDLETVPPATDDTLFYDAVTKLWSPGAIAGFDPDDPLDYLSMVDTVTGDVVQVSIANGAWVFTTVDFRVTEAGDTRVTEDGNVRITEG